MYRTQRQTSQTKMRFWEILHTMCHTFKKYEQEMNLEEKRPKSDCVLFEAEWVKTFTHLQINANLELVMQSRML